MRRIINDLFGCMNLATDQRTINELATIIRREVEQELMISGYKMKPRMKEVPSEPFRPVPDNMVPPTREELHIANNESKLNAVKAYRIRTGHNLVDSKHLMEGYMDNPFPH